MRDFFLPAAAIIFSFVACKSSTPPPPPQPAASTASAPASVSAVVADGGAAVAADDAGAEKPAKTEAASEPGMLLVKGGTFAMGADEGGEGDERPAHQVTVASFWLDKTEVTQAAYEECVTAKSCR